MIYSGKIKLIKNGFCIAAREYTSREHRQQIIERFRMENYNHKDLAVQIEPHVNPFEKRDKEIKTISDKIFSKRIIPDLPKKTKRPPAEYSNPNYS